MDPFRGYANAIDDHLDEATPALDAFHVVKLGGKALDEVRRRVQQTTLGRRGHAQDPLYRIRNILRSGAENLTDRQQHRLAEAIAADEPTNTEAASLVRNLEFMLRASAHDPSIVDTAAPGDVDAQLAAADVLLANQQPEAAFDRIIALVKVTAGDDRTKARTRLLELFELFDPAEPFVITARRKLASALY